MDVRWYDEVDSTMVEARRLAEAGAPHGTVVVARAQRHGRGRRGRVWCSERDAGLWMTCLWRVVPKGDGVPPPRGTWAGPPVAELAIVVGVAVCEAVQGLLAEGQTLGLKWPNDVVVNARKLAGVLLEGEPGLVRAGIGINLQQPPNTPQAIGLNELRGAPLTADDLLHRLLPSLEKGVATWLHDGLHAARQAWQQRDVLRGRCVRAEGPNGLVQGVADGLAEDGALRLQTAAGSVTVRSGEVARVRPANEPEAGPHVYA